MEYIFFWGHHEKPDKITKACLSQWYPATFKCDGVEYLCAEQYMMAAKARTFGDTETLERILESDDPKTIKALGRAVRGFDSVVWDTVKYEYVVKANICKFNQNPSLKEFLLSTQGKTLVEASPYDTIWGIGMDEKEARVISPDMWKGQNLLGKALMEVRENL